MYEEKIEKEQNCVKSHQDLNNALSKPFRSHYYQVKCPNDNFHKIGSPGLVVMGGDSCTEGRGFESQCCILDGHFFTLICCKIVLMFV